MKKGLYIVVDPTWFVIGTLVELTDDKFGDYGMFTDGSEGCNKCMHKSRVRYIGKI